MTNDVCALARRIGWFKVYALLFWLSAALGMADVAIRRPDLPLYLWIVLLLYDLAATTALFAATEQAQGKGGTTATN